MSESATRTVRTAVQTLLGLLAALPLLVDGGTVSRTLPGLGVALAVATAVTRVMAFPAVQQLLPGWLRTPSAPAAAAAPAAATPAVAEPAAAAPAAAAESVAAQEPPR
ncbi:hypothetical protein P3T36_003184 [Kitasatospora sp. MAP12-15]|uniref:hypothetical protein n=1 Tax=unclassified Kitasatospora TaxID=2633591 RepID=UPI00247BA0F6|nr:hypothetical protein [Kitasatospora sp. MAP12-44]